MKNYLIILFIACSTFVSAQSLELFYNGELVQDTITIPFESTIAIDYYVDIVNVSTNTINIQLEHEFSIIPEAVGSFCFPFSCYLWGVNSVDSYSLAGGDTLNKSRDGGFHVTYKYTDGNTGTSLVKFIFSDEDNPLDNVSVVFKFVSGNVGICNPNRQTVQTFETYPNPANSTVFVKYGLNKESSDIQLILHSLTGSIIKTIPVNASESTVRVDVEDLAQGIYFCSLKIDGVISSSKKIVVTK